MNIPEIPALPQMNNLDLNLDNFPIDSFVDDLEDIKNMVTALSETLLSPEQLVVFQRRVVELTEKRDA